MSMEKLPIIPKNTVVELQADRFAVGGQEISFLEDSDFVNAWNEVMDEIKPKVDDDNIKKSFWRAHVVNTLFVNSYRPGCCYVECGTNLGIMSRMVFKLNREKSFKKYLFDTWQGIPESQFSDDEPLGTWHNNHSYNEDLFDFIEPLNAEFQDITFVRGEIPETLSQTYANISPSFLHIDMNIEYPERKALEFFVPQMKPGSVVLLDDYGFARHSKQRHSQDNFFRRLGKQPTQMPTGQAFVLL
mgnify:CR=1 FL=1